MKLFQKIAAITLAGIAALTFLTGCSQPEPRATVDKTAEIVAVLNDSLHSSLAADWGGDLDAKEYKTDVRMNTTAQKAVAILSSKLSADEELATLEGKNLCDKLKSEGISEELQKAIVESADDHDLYYIFYVKNTAYTSGVFNSLKKYEIARFLRKKDNGITLNFQDEYDAISEDAVVLVGSAETKDGSYTAVVMKWPTQAID